MSRFVAFMENKVYEVQTIRTYMGSKYRFGEIKDYLRVNGIIRVLTGRRPHAQIHVKERKNRTLPEMD